MSFGFSIGDFLAIIEIVKEIRRDFVEAPAQLKNLAEDVRNLSIVLQDAEVLVLGDSGSELSDQQKTNLKEFASSCRQVLLDLQQTLGKYKDLTTTGGNMGKRVKRIWKRLEFEPDDVRELRQRLTSNVILLQTFVTQISRQTTVAIKKGVDHLSLREDDQERLKVLNWLTPTDYAAQQSDYIGRRQPGTGQWLLDSPEFQTWMRVGKQTLFCPGIPGAGKTILTSIVVDKLLNDFEDDKTIGIAYIYCNYKRAHEQQASDLISSLIRQLAGAQPALPASVKLLHGKHKDRRTRPSFDELSNTLRSVVSTYSKVFVLVDALDECQTTNGCRHRLVTEIFNLVGQSKTSFFATSRFIPEITERFTGMTTLEIRASPGDVRRYVEGHIPHLPLFVARNPALQEQVAMEISKAVDGMFLLAQLHSNSLVGMRSVKALKAALARLPSGSEAYDVSYQAAMERIQGQVATQTSLAMEVLSWITFAKRPLTTTELQHALAVEDGETQLDEENISEVKDMVSVCAGLVTVDEQSGIIRLVHYTTQEYLKRTGAYWFPDAESDITKTCITYMSLDAFSRGSCKSEDEFEQRLRRYPLYLYTARNWGDHARHSSRLGQEVVNLLLYKAKHVEALCQALRRAPDDEGTYSELVVGDGLHLAAAVGCERAIEALGQAGVNLDSPTMHGQTPLCLAANFGHESVVKLLLDDGKVDANSSDKYGMTPLHWAASRGHEAVVKLFLDNGKADANSRGHNIRTPLGWAVNLGREAVVKLLLDSGKVDPNSSDKYGMAPLQWAASDGHEAVVKLLLDSGKVDANSRGHKGPTPLACAAREGHQAVVRLLLGTDGVDANLSGYDGHTPLSWAARKGQETVVRLLLAAETVDPDSSGTGRWTPLCCAAESGHEEVVRLLLDTGKVNANWKDSLYGRTPLIWAAMEGYEGVVRCLVESGSADVNAQDLVKRTALSYAAKHGHEMIAAILLSNSSVDPDSKDLFASTPLTIATRNHRTEVARQLIGTGRVDLDSRDCFRRTPLWYAKRYGHDDIAELLLHAANKSAISLRQDDLPEGVYLQPQGESRGYCDICTMGLYESVGHYSETCKVGYFRCCASCYEAGEGGLELDQELVENMLFK